MTVNKRLKELTKDRKDKRFIESQGKAPIAKTDLVRGKRRGCITRIFFFTANGVYLAYKNHRLTPLRGGYGTTAFEQLFLLLALYKLLPLEYRFTRII